MPNPPPGVTQGDLNRALDQLEEIVGRDWVFRSDEDVLLYRDAYSPLWDEEQERHASAAVAPVTVEEVQAVVRLANEFQLPLYPISTGRNLTYGGSAPTYTGSVVLDLKRMNRILDVNERDKTCLVEPGVSYFDMYRHLRDNNIRLWIDTADPGWGGLIGNALDRGGGYTGVDYRDHFDAHCGMEVVLPTGELLRTGMGANENATTWQLYKYGLGPWVDGIFSQSNFGVVTKMGFWLMEEPEAARQFTITVPRKEDGVAFIDTLHSLMCEHTIPSQTNASSPVMNGSADPELVRLRTSGGASDTDWNRYAASSGRPFWSTTFVLYGASRVIDAQWEEIRDRFSGIGGAQFTETASYRFPLSDAEVEAVPDKARYGIPSLNLFGSRTSPDAQPNEGHLDFSPMVRPRADEMLALYDISGRIYGEHGMTPGPVAGAMFHARSMICFHPVPTFRNAQDNRRTRAMFEQLVTECGENGWPIYRIHSHFQDLGMSLFDFNNHALLRLHETIKDAIDPQGVISPGRYNIWPRHLRGSNA